MRTNGETRREAATGAVLIAINCGAWSWAWGAFADRPALLATAALAYSLGLRHAFDADHIAAIDNVVRKLMQHGRPAQSVGLFFSLGHSTVVVAGCIALTAAADTLLRRLGLIRDLGGIIGTVLSGTFLLIIGVANLRVLSGISVALARAHRGERADAASHGPLLPQGLLIKILHPLLELVRSPWHMYLVGLLFGLGFDTTTEIGLLSISAGASRSLSRGSILVFPALFTAGMSLMDTLDSMIMSRAYGWAFVQPTRKLTYNLIITALSAVVALFIGGAEALGLLASKLNFSGSAWSLISALNNSLGRLGYAVVATLVAVWVIFLARHRRPGSVDVVAK